MATAEHLCAQADQGGLSAAFWAGEDSSSGPAIKTRSRSQICALAHNRQHGQKVKVLCPVCAAPRLALQAVSQLLSDLKLAATGGPTKTLTFEETPMQLRPMLAAEVWEPLIDSSGDEPPTYATNLHQLQALRPRLEAVRQTLVTALEMKRAK